MNISVQSRWSLAHGKTLSLGGGSSTITLPASVLNATGSSSCGQIAVHGVGWATDKHPCSSSGTSSSSSSSNTTTLSFLSGCASSGSSARLLSVTNLPDPISVVMDQAATTAADVRTLACPGDGSTEVYRVTCSYLYGASVAVQVVCNGSATSATYTCPTRRTCVSMNETGGSWSRQGGTLVSTSGSRTTCHFTRKSCSLPLRRGCGLSIDTPTLPTYYGRRS